MRTHTIGFKTALATLGRSLKATITYGQTVLEEELYTVTPHFEANLLKSVMKQLDLECSVDIPKETIINCQIGLLVNNSYEMLDFGNYVVYSSEKQEDTNTYKIICYDKMIYTMKQNEDLEIAYPITIKNYLTALANKIGLSVANATFYNSNLEIPEELYLGQEYTYRDILDEIAQATGSIIYINNNDEIELKYPINTNDVIDENYLKDINVNFGQKYGPINSIILSRSGESDNVYIQDAESIEENGLCEIKIIDNQIMNFNNRSDFLQGILNALDNVYYYINDFLSLGILYYEVGDLYNILVGENTYQCLMLNDEINVTTGIEEIINTDMPEQSETDYSKADKTDRKINQTYLIVDKQNQAIESVISNVTQQNNKISQITQTVDDLSSQIQDIADITKAEESQIAVVNLTDINESEPIMIKVKPITKSIKKLYPKKNLYPSNSQYLTTRTIMFKRTYTEEEQTLTQYIPYELPDDLLYYNSNNYDEFYLDYDSNTCQITKRCEWFGGNGINLFNPQYFDGVKQNISNITISQDEKYTITPSNTSSGITLNNRFYISRGQSQVLYFTNLTNILSTNITITIRYYNFNNVLINTFEVSNNSTRIYIDEDVSYYTLSFTFSERTSGENFGFNIQLNDGSNEESYETHYPSIKPTGTEQVVSYPYPQILLGNGDYEVTLQGYDIGYLFIRLMAQNIYTTQFATRAELSTSIIQTESEITSIATAKVGKNEIISMINQSSEAVTIDANKISLAGKSINLTGDDVEITSNNFSLDSAGNVIANSGTLGGWNLSNEGLIDSSGNIFLRNNGYSSIYTYADIVIIRNYLEGKITLSNTDIEEHYDINHDGVVNSADLLLLRQKILGIE